MTRSTVVKTNQVQAVLIPEALAFDESVKEVEVVRHGDALTITPRVITQDRVYKDWKDWFENGPRVTDDFMDDIDDQPPETREPI